MHNTLLKWLVRCGQPEGHTRCETSALSKSIRLQCLEGKEEKCGSLERNADDDIDLVTALQRTHRPRVHNDGLAGAVYRHGFFFGVVHLEARHKCRVGLDQG